MDGSDWIILKPDRLASLRHPFNISTVHCKSGYSGKLRGHTICGIERFVRICLSLRGKRIPFTLDLELERQGIIIRGSLLPIRPNYPSAPRTHKTK
jgi:hypothetical protein